MKAILASDSDSPGLLAACSSSSSSDTSNDGTNTDNPGNGGNGGTTSGGGGGGENNGGSDGGGSTTPEEQTASGCKRGVAYGYHSKADMQALSKGVSWWYNWAYLPDEGREARPLQDARRRVRTDGVGRGNLDTAAAIACRDPRRARASLLGFNEPNFGGAGRTCPRPRPPRSGRRCEAVADARAASRWSRRP